MKSTTGVAIGILIGLQQLDQQLEKVNPEVRLKIAILINKLRPLGDAFDRTQSRLVQDVNKQFDGQPPNPALTNALLTEGVAKLRDEECEIDLKALDKRDLKLDDNPKVNALTLANILPILEGYE